ncbi:porin [Candidatus Margulisiibacteriota bacterium]
MKFKKYMFLLLIVICIFRINSFAATEKKPLIIEGFLQTQFTQSDSTIDQFKIAKARFRFKGYLDENVYYNILADGVTSPALWVAHLNMTINEFLTLRGGQFKSPFSKTYLPVAHTWNTINLPNSIDNIAHKYDIGVQVMGQYNIFKYAVGLFNGAGRNTADSNDSKDIIGRVDIVNPIPGFEIGGSGFLGKDNTNNKNKKGGALNIRYKKDALDIHSELMLMSNSVVKEQGGFVLVGYKLLPDQQAIVMVDSYDPDAGISGDRQDSLTLGWNWFVTKKTKLQVNYLMMKEETNEVDNNQLTAQWQVVF